MYIYVPSILCALHSIQCGKQSRDSQNRYIPLYRMAYDLLNESCNLSNELCKQTCVLAIKDQRHFNSLLIK